MLSQTVEYALRAAVYLADQAPNPRTTEQIANVTKVPQAYLSKVMQSLSRAGLVNSQRGLRGGFALARPTEAITILEVVNAVDPIQRIQACPLGIPTHGTNLCALHRRLDQALEAVERAFRETTLAEVLAEPSKSMPLCSMPNEILVQLG
jgi:Rrf2 family transcriptional regulator, nitric oxide-sensitive transcriptional repressor